jgi:hypothetical protein
VSPEQLAGMLAGETLTVAIPDPADSDAVTLIRIHVTKATVTGESTKEVIVEGRAEPA